MKVATEEKDQFQIGFELVEDGWHTVVIREIKDYVKDNSQGITTGIHMETVDVEPSKVTDFVVRITKEGEKSRGYEKYVEKYIIMTGMRGYFESKVPDTATLFDAPAQNALKTALIDKQLQIHTKQVTENYQGATNTRVKIDGMAKVGAKVEDKAAGKVSEPKKATQAPDEF